MPWNFVGLRPSVETWLGSQKFTPLNHISNFYFKKINNKWTILSACLVCILLDQVFR